VSVTHQSPAYLDEEYPIVISIINEDYRPLDILLDVLLQPTEIDDAVNTIRVDDEHSQSLIKHVTLGTITPGDTTLKTLYLRNTGGVGDRVLDISIQSRSPVAQDTSEVLRTLFVPTVAPMKVEHGVKYLYARGPLPSLTNLHTYESDYWDDGEGGEALVRARMMCMGPWGVSVETARLVRKVSLMQLISAMVVLTSIRMDLMLGCSSVLWTRMKKMLRQVPGFRCYPDLLADGSQNGFLGMNLPLCVMSVFP